MNSDATTTMHSPRHRTAAVLWTLALIAYIAAITVCTATDRPLPAALLLLALLVVTLIRELLAGKRGAAGFLALNAVFFGGVLWFAGPMQAMEVTLIIVQASVSAIFLRGLAPGRVDFVTRIARAIRPERSPRELAYTRRVAWAWVIFMALLAATSLVFVFFASERLWWWWRLVGSWALPVAFFGAEWLYRQRILRGQPRVGARNVVRALRRIDYPHLFEI